MAGGGRVAVEVAGEGDFLADLGLGLDYPGVADVGEDLAVEVGLDVVGEANVLVVAEVWVGQRLAPTATSLQGASKPSSG